MSRRKQSDSDMFDSEETLTNLEDEVGDYYSKEKGELESEVQEQIDEQETSVFNDTVDADENDAFTGFDSYDFATPHTPHKEFASIYDAETQKRTIIKTTILLGLLLVAGLVFYFTSAHFKFFATEHTYGPISFDSTQQFETVYSETKTRDDLTYDDMVINRGKVRIKIMKSYLTEDKVKQLEQSAYSPNAPSPENLGLKESQYNYEGDIRYYGGVELEHGNVARAYYSILDIPNAQKYDVSVYGDRISSSEIVNIFRSMRFDGIALYTRH